MSQQPIETDAVIIGAGPVGLFQVFELGLLDIKAQVIDSLPRVGGQCVELYADKPIYDIPGIPVCTGQELINNLLKQIEPFRAQFHLDQTIYSLAQQADGRFKLTSSLGTEFLSRTVFIAAGVGAFLPRTLKLDGIEAFTGKQLFYHVQDPKRHEGQDIVICGGDDLALEWAIHFANKAKSVTLVHRRDDFKATPINIARMRDLCAQNAIQLCIGQITGYKVSQKSATLESLSAIELTDIDGKIQVLPLDTLLVFLGLSPKLGPISDWGIDLDRKQVMVNTASFQTSIPGIYAVGDINTYPGKKKLILSGFHEATLAAFAAAEYLNPEKPIQLQYTTTSPRLHQALGVKSSTFE